MEPTASRAIEYTFPEEYTGHASYREAPFHIIEDFKAHVKETYTPETFPGLYWGRLRTNEPFEILHQFAIDRKRRPEGDYIPCPMCRKREKFLEGSLVFLFGRQCVAIIGHDCAAAEVKHAALSKKKADDARRHQEDFLMARLTHVPGILREMEALKPIATEIEGIFHDFKQGAPSIQKALRQVRKTGGEYIVTEMIDNEAARYDDRLPKKVARDSHFGSLRGDALVRASCKFLIELRKYEQWLLSFAGCEDETAAMDMTIGLLERKEAAKAVQYIGTAGRKLGWLRYEMSAACFFFAEGHVEDLREWGRDRLHPNPFEVDRQVRNDGTAVILSRRSTKDQEREYARLFLSAGLAEWAEANRRMPDLETL
ncbi:hypothetical protein X735_22565 [Mesorhizobium sp. L2C085B000]|uniref:hypothetical protein n=1 Tax=Mesorhizobium sp. L2C085B000 TaxID=1287117 RepID=UPI0003D04645|nr:hypothetical protein [Mesorhizobium sp. L2C085B000]ESZ12408.1 hypothetical protein X735_22565 [Mesorhizobium sp. L2C085B000]